jgi:hypothetical protein
MTSTEKVFKVLLEIVQYKGEKQVVWFSWCLERGLIAKGTTQKEAVEGMLTIVKLDLEYYAEHPHIQMRRPCVQREFDRYEKAVDESVVEGEGFSLKIKKEEKS